MTLTLIVAVVVGVALWLAGASTLVSFLELIDALRPDKPDGKPVRLWVIWILVAVVAFPLVMVLGIFRAVVSVLHRTRGEIEDRSVRSPSDHRPAADVHPTTRDAVAAIAESDLEAAERA